MILRLPPALADDVHDRLATGASLADLSLSFTDPAAQGHGPDSAAYGRLAQFKVDGQKFRARMQELPCIVEAQKTRDKKPSSLFIKAGDISQMVVVYEHSAELPDDREPESYLAMDGLTLPNENATARFRKCELTEDDTSVMHAVEKEVQRVIEKDREQDDEDEEYEEINLTQAEIDHLQVIIASQLPIGTTAC